MQLHFSDFFPVRIEALGGRMPDLLTVQLFCPPSGIIFSSVILKVYLHTKAWSLACLRKHWFFSKMWKTNKGFLRLPRKSQILWISESLPIFLSHLIIQLLQESPHPAIGSRKITSFNTECQNWCRRSQFNWQDGQSKSLSAPLEKHFQPTWLQWLLP